ncbi:hypothetical protein B484DRAFT_405286 [Ochromonadaceae sp. CCMP2298]|nr:hypothetical protein B484DRAFT_405286 [Ochromonadaceae sp. CCMP2298]|mmetsp:Transcript_20729/g.46155  ORF Transcript_20729/g.46155 Transcript_20729/m.46155 type:complete len:158 (-) Transcript_20729:2092-2565(-)
MEAKPFIIVRASKPISVSKVHKSLKKFLHSQAHPSTALSTTGAIAALPDDVTNKLVTVLAELEELKGTADDSEPIVSVKSSGTVTPYADAMVDSSGKKKRKKSRESEGGLEKKKNRKDKHRDSVESSMASTTPVVVVASAKKDVDKLNSMKKAAKKE